MKKELILASQSPRRRELLSFITDDFEVMPSNIDESIPEGMGPEDAVKMLSYKKARSIADKKESAFVIGSDTVIVFNGKILGKPETADQARKMLSALSGNSHVVMSGVTIIKPGEESFAQEVVNTSVKFRPISEDMLEWYIKSEEYLDKAGSYAIQGKGALFVDSIDGCFYNVMGFPINTIAKMLESLEIVEY